MKSRSSLIGQEPMTNQELLDKPIIEAQASTTTCKDIEKLNVSSVSKSLGEAKTSWAPSEFKTESRAPQSWLKAEEHEDVDGTPPESFSEPTGEAWTPAIGDEWLKLH